MSDISAAAYTCFTQLCSICVELKLRFGFESVFILNYTIIAKSWRFSKIENINFHISTSHSPIQVNSWDTSFQVNNLTSVLLHTGIRHLRELRTIEFRWQFSLSLVFDAILRDLNWWHCAIFCSVFVSSLLDIRTKVCE